MLSHMQEVTKLPSYSVNEASELFNCSTNNLTDDGGYVTVVRQQSHGGYNINL